VEDKLDLISRSVSLIRSESSSKEQEKIFQIFLQNYPFFTCGYSLFIGKHNPKPNPKLNPKSNGF